MIVYFVRHASAGQHKSNAAHDKRRPLDSDGIEQCREVGRMLAALNVDVEAVISSPLKRATQTASLVANELGYEGKVHLSPALLPEATYSDFQSALEKYARSESVMVVGHNPSISEFVSLLLSEGATDAAVELKKGAVAKVEITGRHKPAVMTWCVTPKVVHAAYEATPVSSRPKTAKK